MDFLNHLLQIDHAAVEHAAEFRTTTATAFFAFASAGWVKGPLFVARGLLRDVETARCCCPLRWPSPAALVLGDLASGGIKEAVERPRPPRADPGFDAAVAARRRPVPLGPRDHGVRRAVAVAILVPRLRWPALALAATVGLSRVYLGVHFVLDVLAGAALGSLIGVAVALLVRQAARLRPAEPATACLPPARRCARCRRPDHAACRGAAPPRAALPRLERRARGRRRDRRRGRARGAAPRPQRQPARRLLRGGPGAADDDPARRARTSADRRARVQRRAARHQLVGLPARARGVRPGVRGAGPAGGAVGGQARALRRPRHAPGRVGQAHRHAARDGCPPGLGPAVGWDGAPQWATLTDGRRPAGRTTHASSPPRSPRPRDLLPGPRGHPDAARRDLGADRRGARGRAERRRLRPLNEPHPGSASGQPAAALGRYYARAIDAIARARSAERRAADRLLRAERRLVGLRRRRVPPPGFTSDERSCSPRTSTASRSRRSIGATDDRAGVRRRRAGRRAVRRAAVVGRVGLVRRAGGHPPAAGPLHRPGGRPARSAAPGGCGARRAATRTSSATPARRAR